MAGWTKVESEMAAVLVEDLRERGWEVYQEVTVNGNACDIVATQGKIIWAIETKLSMGLPVLAQAQTWIGGAHLVSVATLPSRGIATKELAKTLSRGLGIGAIEIHRPGDEEFIERRINRAKTSQWWLGGGTIEVVRPVYHRTIPSDRIRKSLRPEQKNFVAAGTAGGVRYTPFLATCDLLRHELKDGPLTPRTAAKRLKGRHHYASEASACGSLLAMARRGIIDGVVAEEIGGRAHLVLRAEDE